MYGLTTRGSFSGTGSEAVGGGWAGGRHGRGTPTSPWRRGTGMGGGSSSGSGTSNRGLECGLELARGASG